MGLLKMEMEDMEVTDPKVIHIVVSGFVMCGVSYFNTWPFSTVEKAKAFIASGDGDENTDLDGFDTREEAYRIRTEVIDPE